MQRVSTDRYEAIKVDEKWYVIDHKHPEATPYEAENQKDAEVSARLWSILTRPGGL